MKLCKAQWLIGCVMLAIILSSCNMGATPAPTQDVGAIQTQAFGQILTQVVAAYTPTAMPTNTPEPTATLQAVPPTFAPIGGGDSITTPFAFNTPLPGLTPLALPLVPTVAGAVSTITTKNGCNDGILVSESSPYDGAYLKPGQAYEKSFAFLNTGSCAWDEGYAFVFQPAFSTPDFKGYDIAFRKAEDYTKPGKGITFIIKLNASNVPGEHQGSWKLRDDAGNYFGSLVWVKYMINKK
jgi:hypothetical protein